MSLKINFLSRSLFKLALTALLASTLHASENSISSPLNKFELPPHHSSTCAAILLGLGQIHKVPEVSKYHTQTALERVKDFRQRFLPELEKVATEPTAQDLWITSEKATPQQLAQIEEQLHGLNIHWNRGDKSNLLNMMAGTEIRGEEEISKFLKQTKNATQQISKFKRPKGFWQISKLFGFFFYDFIMGYWLTNIAPQMHKEINEIVQHNYTHAPLLALTIPLFSFYAEHMYRIVKARNYEFKKQRKALENFVENKNERGWIFHSQVYRLPKGLVNMLWKFKYLDYENEISMRETDRDTNIGRTLMNLMFRKKVVKEDYVILDELYSRDPLTGEPVLSLFIRSTVLEPKFPKRPKRIENEVKETELETAASNF